MEIDSSLYHVKVIKGFVTENLGHVTSQQFRAFCYSSQDVFVKVSTYLESPYTTRIIFCHKPFDSCKVRTVGFTSEKSAQGEYQGVCKWNSGVIFLCPVHFFSEEAAYRLRHDHRVVRLRKLLKKTGPHIALTDTALKAAEELFNFLDADCNWFLSKHELSAFKEHMGYEFSISTEEWEEITCFWREDDIINGEISFRLFTDLLVRLAEESFSFGKNNSDYYVNGNIVPCSFASTEKNLRNLFEKFGFSRDLRPDKIGAFTITICSKRGKISPITCQSCRRVDLDWALASTTLSLGETVRIKDSNLQIFTYKCHDWCSIAAGNVSDEKPEKIVVDATGCENVIGHCGLIWQSIVPPRLLKIALCLGRESKDTQEAMQLRCSIIYRNTKNTISVFPLPI